MPLRLLIPLTIYGLAGLVTFITYGLDKRAAIKGRSRVPEKTLHIMELLGGFPGALVAQQVFRHKRRKLRFLVITWLIAVLHAAGWIAVIRYLWMR